MTESFDPLAEAEAESQRTIALADEMLGLTKREVLALIDADTDAGYRVHFIEDGTDNGFRLANLDPRRMYLFTKDGKVVRHESGC